MKEEWLTEPNSEEWEQDVFHCVILRHPSLLHLCGYVGVPKEHQLHGVEYDNLDIDCHGGLTYSSTLSRQQKEDYWYFGFDCAHYNDLVPGTLKYHRSIGGEHYRNFEYVKNEIKEIVKQLSKIAERSDSE